MRREASIAFLLVLLTSMLAPLAKAAQRRCPLVAALAASTTAMGIRASDGFQSRPEPLSVSNVTRRSYAFLLRRADGQPEGRDRIR